VIYEVFDAIEGALGHTIRFPLTEAEMSEQRRGFRAQYGIPCCGIVDGIHFEIETSAYDYLNHKSYSSILAIATINYDGTFSFLATGFPGCFNDSGALNRTWLWRFGIHLLQREDDFLIGDSIFPLRRNLVTLSDWSDYGELTRTQKNLQKALSKTRSRIERSFGQMLKRFPLLHKNLRVQTAKAANQHIMVSAILHNVFHAWRDTCARAWEQVRFPMPANLTDEDEARLGAMRIEGTVSEGEERRQELEHLLRIYH